MTRPKAEGGADPGAPPTSAPASGSRAEIYTYEAPWPVYSISWSVREDQRFRLACGSFLEEYSNAVQIIHLASEDDQPPGAGEKGRAAGAEAPDGKDDAMMDAEYAKREDASAGKLRFHADSRFSFPHPYPTTKIMFMPSSDTSKQDMIATCGDYLRIWPINEEGVNVHEAILLSNVRTRAALPPARDSETPPRPLTPRARARATPPERNAEQEQRVLRAADVLRLERAGHAPDRHELHRHHVHNLEPGALRD